jgi:transcriptional regulator of heat shock response
MLEDKNAFSTFISHLPLNHGVNVFLWEENITPFLHDYSLIVRPISINGKIGYIWVIWSLKMNYSFNISAVKWII